MEENERETLEQCVETTDQNEQSQGGKQHTTPHAQLHDKSEEVKQVQLSAEISQQPLSMLVEGDNNQDETENSPLWSMYFDGSCTKSNAGAGVWITKTENNHIENISCKLNFQCSNNIAEYESLLLGLHLLKML